LVFAKRMPPADVTNKPTLVLKALRLAAIWISTWVLLLLPDLLLYWSGYPVAAAGRFKP
jgi:hypothetical protein